MPTYLSEPTEEALERICDAHWDESTASSRGVKFFDIQKHNACNHTLSGVIDIGGVEHGFIIDNGDWNGTVVRSWGDPEEVGVAAQPEPVPPEDQLTFIPSDTNIPYFRPHLFVVYLHWRKEPWFQDKVRGYPYDRYFQPGGYVENHYREWAGKKGMRIGTLSDLGKEACAVAVSGSTSWDVAGRSAEARALQDMWESIS